MPFDEHVLRHSFAWAGGRCECMDERHGHLDRCHVTLVWERRGQRGEGGWQARFRVPPTLGGTAPENCEVLCWPCYERAELTPVED